MSENTSEVVKEAQSTDQEVKNKKDQGNQYSILEYFKEHTGFFVACISGFVAILSFVLNYGATRYHVAILSYWNIDKMYVDTISGSQLYSFSYLPIYSFALIVVHLFLAKTSEVFARYNRFLSLIGHERKHLKKEHRAIIEHDKTIGQLLEKLPDRQKESKEMQKIGIDLVKMRENADKMLDMRSVLAESQRELWTYTIGNIAISVFLSYLVVFVAFLLMPDLLSWKVISSTAVSAGAIILLDIFMYFVPAYIRSRYPQKRYLEIGMSEALDEVQPLPKYKFPLIDLLLNKPKVVFSNDNIQVLVVQICTTMILMLVALSIVGDQTASTCKEFPIISCDGTTYAIVYNNGTTAFAQEANIEGTSITIRTANQKVMSARDLTFQICEFDKVTKLDVTESDGAQVNEISDNYTVPAKDE